ncbi:MAG: hypothetical protein US40_C0016G0021 [Candidatus Roizmanbacteria bacterium GW2011_GWC2_37_13]|uniref:Four helix bundle protein n=1 Tax=Candidatus Roizmanbacteria bacterium GW2011_GWC2_37_13 TaxID=1618486 RepID=A0A0G0IJR9_9BACT|nr:MAG: hypothetical protein US38_C0017G0018 [Candidatus Roizmanbacteria bacterium GW2011_GWC1_37_12]KKQ24459.1 MAG: hypothetical protein US40_C0016G0021 [Candidatus Roizmanbacteria bacterium GW2011_GWC2_37_13]
MNKYSNTEKDIHKRIYKFVISCFNNIVKKIPKTVENLPIIEQISSSLTSMGANDREADASTSRKDFIAKYTIVKKETKETEYWLSVIKDTFLVKEVYVSNNGSINGKFCFLDYPIIF